MFFDAVEQMVSMVYIITEIWQVHVGIIKK